MHYVPVVEYFEYQTCAVSVSPNGIPKGIPNGIPNGIPYDIPNGIFKGMPNGVPHDIMLFQRVFVDYIFIFPNLKMFLQVM